MEADPELILKDARSILDARWRMAQIAQGAAEVPDVGVEDENLDGLTDAVEVQEAPGAPTKP